MRPPQRRLRRRGRCGRRRLGRLALTWCAAWEADNKPAHGHCPPESLAGQATPSAAGRPRHHDCCSEVVAPPVRLRPLRLRRSVRWLRGYGPSAGHRQARTNQFPGQADAHSPPVCAGCSDGSWTPRPEQQTWSARQKTHGPARLPRVATVPRSVQGSAVWQPPEKACGSAAYSGVLDPHAREVAAAGCSATRLTCWRTNRP